MLAAFARKFAALSLSHAGVKVGSRIGLASLALLAAAGSVHNAAALNEMRDSARERAARYGYTPEAPRVKRPAPADEEQATDDDAVEFSLGKARQIVDQQGDRMFGQA